MIKKIRHLIETSINVIIIYINYLIIIQLIRQINLNIVLIKKFNLRLIKTFKYLQRFRIKVRHKLNKMNIVFDVLFRLINRDYDIILNESKLDALIANVYLINLI